MAGADRSGLERLEAWRDGAEPHPALALLDAVLETAADGRVRLAAPPLARFRNINGTMHGGWISTLLDEAAGMAVLSTLDRGETYATLNLAVSFLRAAGTGEARFTIEGWVVRRGGRVATSEARLVRGDGKPCASAVATCLISRAPDG